MTKPKRSRLRRFLGWFVEPFRRRRDLNDEPDDDEEDFEEEFDDEPGALWPESRLQVAQRLWGDGFVRCGEADYLREFVPLMGLSERNSLLLIGAGLGGAGQKIVEDTSAWVTGYENQEELAAIGKERVKRAGLAKRPPVNFAAFDDIKLKARAYDACISLESLYMAADKKSLLGKVFESMRDNAELWYTDFVLPSTDPPNATVQAWADAQPEAVHLWPSDVVQALLRNTGFDVQPGEDITHAYRMRLFKSLFNFLASTNKAELLEIVDGVFAELEALAALVSALDSGGLKVYRFHAFKPRGRG
jgi:cyclopropane fatty-acyl-phospholipid synthase-like methyltransferase